MFLFDVYFQLLSQLETSRIQTQFNYNRAQAK